MDDGAFAENHGIRANLAVDRRSGHDLKADRRVDIPPDGSRDDHFRSFHVADHFALGAYD